MDAYKKEQLVEAWVLNYVEEGAQTYSVLVQTYAHTAYLGTHNVYVLSPKSML